MRNIILLYSVMIASAAFSASPAMLMNPQYGDPVKMTGTGKRGIDAFTLATGFFGSDGATAFTAMIWVKWTARAGYPVGSSINPFVMSSCTCEQARSTREGGPSLTNLSPVGEDSDLPLIGGRWSANCLPAAYDVPDSLSDSDWRFGCYCFNVTTDSGLTLNVGGEELYIPATNGMVRNIKAASASRSVSIVAERTNAHVKFGIAEMPIVQFVGAQCDGMLGSTSAGDSARGGMANGEWRMFVVQGSIVGDNLVVTVSGYTQMDKLQNVGSANQEMWHKRSTFAKDARFSFMAASACGLADKNGNEDVFDIYGFKCYRGLLSETMIQTIRDQDVATMRRRRIIQ